MLRRTENCALDKPQGKEDGTRLDCVVFASERDDDVIIGRMSPVRMCFLSRKDLVDAACLNALFGYPTIGCFLIFFLCSQH